MNRRRIIVSAAIALLVVVCGYFLPVRNAATENVQMFTTLPGLLIASLVWPEGAHSRSGLGAREIWLMFGTMYVVSFAFWTFVAWMIQSGLQRWSHRNRHE
jgi:hypothetical protein